MAFLQVFDIWKTYRGEPEPCVRGMSFGLEKGQIMVLLGGSGCGKSTVLKMIAGLEGLDRGSVIIDGEDMGTTPPEKRPISMVFQKALLFNNMTVEQNVNFAPRVNHTMDKAKLAERTEQMLELVGLGGLGKKKATALSGGQEQRVSLARALMVEPKLLLLDEPLSALDAGLRENMQSYIRKLNRDTGTTMVMVTHDQQEAIALADVIAVMHEGTILQMGQPQEFYAHPRTHYVASFFGWRNFVPAQRQGNLVTCALGTFPVAVREDAPVEGYLAVRPEAAKDIGAGSLTATVTGAVYKGLDIAYEVDVCGVPLRLDLPERYGFAVGSTFSFNVDESHVWFVEPDESATGE